MENWQVVLQVLSTAVPIAVVLIQYHLDKKKNEVRDEKLHYWEEEIVKEQGRLQRGVEFYKIAVTTIDDVATMISYLDYVFDRAVDHSLPDDGNNKKDFARMRVALLELSRCKGRLAATVSDQTLTLYEVYFEVFSTLVERLNKSEWIGKEEMSELKNAESMIMHKLRDEKMRLQEELSEKMN